MISTIKTGLGACALVLLTIVACWLSPEPRPGSGAGVKMSLPDFLGGYIGVDQEISEAELAILPRDTQFVRKTYHNPAGDRILCSIVLSGAEKRSIHRPEICLPGQGWTVQGGESRKIELEEGRSLRIMDLSLSREVSLSNGETKLLRSHYFYWFVGKDSVTPFHARRIFMTSWDRVVKRVNHQWAYVIVSSNVTDNLQHNGKTDSETVEMLKEFTSKVAPNILKQDVLDGLW